MNKTEISIVVLLFLVLLGWGFLYRQFAPAHSPQPVRPVAKAPGESGKTGTNAVGAAKAETPTLSALREAPLESLSPAAAPVAARHGGAEQTVVISNALASVAVSSWGGSIVRMELSGYRSKVDPQSGPVILDFGSRPALSLTGIPGLSADADFAVSPGPSNGMLRVQAAASSGLKLVRTLTLGQDYRMDVEDVFRNDGGQPVTLPGYSVALGPMHEAPSRGGSSVGPLLGLNTLADAGGASVERWEAKVIPSLFGAGGSGCSGARVSAATPTSVLHKIDVPLVWAAAKNRFFVEILAPEGGCAGAEVHAARDPAAQGAMVITTVSADLRFLEKTLQPGESLTRRMSYYSGPTKYAMLKQLGHRQDEVMLYAWWEWFRWLCTAILWTLNEIHQVIPNYGIAIILLTMIVRLIFWPVTRKGAESMKRMQALQPKVAEIRARLKDKPQKMNQEVMALYKENKVNPMAGCLPMVVQMPVFIALFNVLRSAVELRFARFLWIRDLSEPEGILAGTLPFGGINILPLLMTATTIWQQKLTPTGGDPQQQKMMMLMPIFMLFLFYNMASALVLYWTVSQLLAIGGILFQRYHKGK